jgi:hypothetical protein
VVWEGSFEGYTARVPIYSWENFMKLGEKVPDAAVKARIDGTQTHAHTEHT